MSGLVSRAWQMILCRVTNYAIMLLSPVLLVRVLDVKEYGQYREFMLYAMLFAGFIGFSIHTNLLYFIPRSPEKEKEYLTSTAAMMLLSTVLGIATLYAFRPLFIRRISYDFTNELALFLFCFLNLDLLDTYWLAKKKTHYVLYFSTARMFFRIVSVLLAAYFTHDVRFVILALIVVEATRLALALLYLIFSGSFSSKVDLSAIKEQVIYFAPLGLVSLINYFNRDVGKIFVSTSLGVTALAIYTIGSYQLPFLTIIRASVGDVIFPEISQRNSTDKGSGLDLWKKSNVVFCLLVFPLFAIFFYYSDVFVSLLFTSNYKAATPIFRIYMLWMLRQCFEMSIPIRSMNRNTQFLASGLISAVFNLSLIVLLSTWVGILGPAIAFVVSDLAQASYLARVVMALYDSKLSDLFSWHSVMRIGAGALAATPILFLGGAISMHPLLRALLFSGLYGTCYIVILLWMKVPEAALLIKKILPSRFSVVRAR